MIKSLTSVFTYRTRLICAAQSQLFQGECAGVSGKHNIVFSRSHPQPQHLTSFDLKFASTSLLTIVICVFLGFWVILTVALNVECGRRLQDQYDLGQHALTLPTHSSTPTANSRLKTRPPVSMASFDKDGVSPALQVTIIICWSRFNC